MKNNRIITALIGCCFCLLALPFSMFSVSADAIWSPIGDNFYDEHWMECIYSGGRHYQANGEEGKVILWDFPNSLWKVAEYENGTEFQVVWLYTDENDVVWTVIEDFVEESIPNEKYPHREYFSGWIRMSDLLVIYDHFSFIEEHDKSLTTFDGKINPDVLDQYVYWQYPGSEKINETWLEYNMPLAPEDVVFPYEYVDENNHSWVYTEVGYGKLGKGWIYLDDPTNDKIYEPD